MLYRPESGEVKLSHFYGPNLNDRLDLKLDKLITAQLRKPVPSELRSPVNQTKIERSLWLAGILYYPFKMFFENITPDIRLIGINPEHERSWWARPSEILSSSIATVFELSKNEWFQNWENLKLKTPIESSYLENLAEPIFVAAFTQGGVELQRGFIVPENW
jgi:hypothetical protein